MKELKLKWHPEASSDLTAITRYCHFSFGRKVARNVRTKILHDVELLRSYPYLAPIEHQLEHCTSLQYRGLVVSNQTKVIYSVHTDYIYIHLLWDVRQNEKVLVHTIRKRYYSSKEEQKNRMNEPEIQYETK